MVSLSTNHLLGSFWSLEHKWKRLLPLEEACEYSKTESAAWPGPWAWP